MPPLLKAFTSYLKRSAFLKLLFKVGFTLFAFWIVFYEIDQEQMAAIVSKQDIGLMVVTYLLMNAQAVIGALRWRLIIIRLAKAGQHVLYFTESLKICFIGMFFNNCLPGGTVGGDALRVWLAKSDAVPLSLSIHSVIIDRVIALLALFIMVLFTLPAMGNMAGFNGVLLVPALLALYLAGAWILLNMERLFGRFGEYALVRQLLHFAASLREMLVYPKTSLQLMGYALLGHVVFCLGVVFTAESLNIQLSFVNSLVLIPPVVLVSTLPISIGGWGVRELSMIAMLSLIGIPQEEALILSLEGGVMSIIVGLPGGVFWLLHKRRGGNMQPLDEKAA
jgi:uncharacterized protein (TIRG00374 family)